MPHQNDHSNSPSPLENASDDIKLAVDLIYLLESNQVEPSIALSAINIVKADLERRIKE